MKICNNCKILKTDKEFYFTIYKKISRREPCILCTKKINAQYKANKTKKQKILSKQRVKETTNKRERLKRKTNQVWKLRKYLSSKITRALKSVGSCKQMSFLKFVPYTMNEFKLHLESLFEPWMSWDNHGPYKRKTWDDNNQATWTWSIDHIIPQSDLPYSSMEEDNFKKCWALENLRPLSSKQNLIEGVTRIRHN